MLYTVTHHLESGLTYESGPSEFADARVRLIVKEGKVVAVEHTLEDETSHSRDEIKEQSTQRSSVFLQLLSFLSGLPVRVSHSFVKAEVGTDINGFVSHTTDSVAWKPLQIPALGNWCKCDWLPIWLHLFNSARADPSPVDALRSYHMVLESKPPKNKSKSSGQQELSDEDRVRLARNFVSHGKKLVDQQLLRYLAYKIGAGTDQFDPTDRRHQEFVKEHCELARNLAAKQIGEVLNQ